MTIEEKIASLLAQINTLKSEIGGSPSDLETICEELESLNADVASINANVSTLTENLTSLNAEFEEVKTEVNDISGEVAGIDADITTLKTEVNGLDTRVSQLEEGGAGSVVHIYIHSVYLENTPFSFYSTKENEYNNFAEIMEDVSNGIISQIINSSEGAAYPHYHPMLNIEINKVSAPRNYKLTFVNFANSLIISEDAIPQYRRIEIYV